MNLAIGADLDDHDIIVEANYADGFTGAGQCPLSTEKLVDLVMAFLELFNKQEPAKITLYEYQRKFIRRCVESILLHDGATITGLWSRQSGKSEALACLVVALCVFLPSLARVYPKDPRLENFFSGIKIGIFAPKDKQAKIIYDRVRSRALSYGVAAIYDDPDINTHVVNSRADQVLWSNGSMCRASTASDRTNAEGDTYHLLLLDEAQLISEQKEEKELRPFLSSTNGTTCKIGTVGYSKGAFSKSIEHNVEKEEDTGKRSHFEFPVDVVIAERRKTYKATGERYHLNYERHVKAELDRMKGVENAAFKMNYRLERPESGSNAIDITAFENAANDDFEIGDLSPYRNRFRYVAGIDFARKRDMTVVVVMEVDISGMLKGWSGTTFKDAEESTIDNFEKNVYVRPNKRIVGWALIPGARLWRDIVRDAARYIRPFDVDLVFGDGTGVGDPVVEMLAEALPEASVESFVFSGPKADPLFREYVAEIEVGRVTYPAGENTCLTPEFEEFTKQHRELQKERKKAGYWSFFVPEENGHDDFCDAAALACAAAHTERDSAAVTQSENPFYGSEALAARRSDRYRRR